MNRVAIVTVLVLVGVALAPATTAGQTESAAVEPTPTTAEFGHDANGTETGNDSNASLGASVSAFMQSNAERASQAVDQGMWSAAFHRSDRARKQNLAEAHVGTLRERLDALATERKELLAAYRNGSISKIEFQARMSALVERYQALNQSVDDTKRAIGRENVDAPGLAELDKSLERGGMAIGATGNVTLPANVTVPGFDRGSNGPPFDDNRTTGPPGDDPSGNGNGGPGEGAGGPSANASTPNATTDTPLDGNGTLNTTVVGRIAGSSDEQTPF